MPKGEPLRLERVCKQFGSFRAIHDVSVQIEAGELRYCERVTPETMTLPVKIWSGIREEITPTIAAVSSLLIAFTVFIYAGV